MQSELLIFSWLGQQYILLVLVMDPEQDNTSRVFFVSPMLCVLV